MNLLPARSIILLMGIILLSSTIGYGQDISASVDLTYTYDRTEEEETTDKNTLKFKGQAEAQGALNLKFDYSSKAVLEYNVDNEKHSPESWELKPSIEMTVKSEEMEWKGGIKFTDDYTGSSDGEESITKTNWDDFIEFKLKDGKLPDITAKYTYKKDDEEDTTDKLETGFDSSLDYTLGDLKVKLDYKESRTDDDIPGAEDKESVENKVDVSYKRAFYREMFDVSLSYKYNDKNEKTLDDAGQVTDSSKTREQEGSGKVKTSLDLAPFTTLDPEYEYKIKKDEIEDSDDISHSIKAALSQGIGWLDAKLSADRKISITDGTDSDSTKTEDSYKAEIKGKRTDWFDVSAKGELKDSVEELDTPGEEDVISRSFSYEGSWKGDLQSLKPSVTYSRKEDYAGDDLVLEKEEDKVKGKLDVELREGIKIEPTYEWTDAKDYDVETEALTSDKITDDLKVKISYDKDLSAYTTLKFSHSYGLKKETTEDEEGETETESVDEDTKISVDVKDICPGLKTSGEVTRKASDQADDDEPLKEDLSYSLKVDGAFNRWKYNVAFKYDDKGGGDDDSWSLDTSLDWEFEELKVGGSYKFTRTLAEIEKDEHKFELKVGYKF